jgi:hypothetical protein
MNQFTLIVTFYATYTTHVLHKVVLGLFEIILCEQLNLLHVYMTQVNTWFKHDNEFVSDTKIFWIFLWKFMNVQYVKRSRWSKSYLTYVAEISVVSGPVTSTVSTTGIPSWTVRLDPLLKPSVGNITGESNNIIWLN